MSKAKLKASIQSTVLNRLSGFSIYVDASEYLWPNEVAIVNSLSNIDLFIIFSPHEQDSSRFTLDVGWSRLKRFPQVPARPCLDQPDIDRSEFVNDEYFTRVGLIAANRDRWWHVGKDGNYKEPLKAATDNIRDIVVPYFEELNDR
jgi:hypothetical protein